METYCGRGIYGPTLSKIQTMKQKVALYGISLMIMTSLHHAYGAWLYGTPWRLQILAFSLPVIILNWIYVKQTRYSKALYYLFCTANLVLSIWFIGLYEGVYNHLFKNLLFFAGVNGQTMASLFPPPMYEMPNDFLFELTGVLQAFIVVPLGYYFIVMLASQRMKRQNGH